MVIKPKSLLSENISNSKFVHTLNSSNLSTSLESNFKTPYKNVEKISPYLNGTKLQILSQMTEKKIVQKKSTEITSSFAQACKIYKANSDEFKSVKGKSRKIKTFVLNKFADPAIPQTVSDMNDTEYLTRVDNNRKYKQRKHRMTKSPSRLHGSRNYEFFNGDLLCRPEPEADPNNLNKSKATNGKTIKTKKKKKGSENIQSSDVWAMLRDMNRFQWISSPPLSDGSVKTIKEKRKCRKNHKDIGFVETCTTEEFSYVSSYDIKSKSQSILSQPSSFDRVTIIDRTADLRTQESIGQNPRSSKKLACQTKHTKMKKKKMCCDSTKHLNDVKICDMKNKVNDALNYNDRTDFNKCLSKESSYECLNRFGSQQTLLDNYDQCIKDMSKIKYDKVVLLKPAYDQCNSVNANVNRRSNDQLLGDSEESSRAELKNLFQVRLSNKYKREIPKVTEVLGMNKRESTGDRAIGAQKNPRNPLINPKLTRTEIRRRLANLKFPIVILGKHEISSNFHFVPYEFEQFNGMDQKIWPYMMEWSEDLTINKSQINRTQNSPPTKCKYKSDLKSTPNNDVSNVLDKDETLQYNTNIKKGSKLISETNLDHNTSSTNSQKSKVLHQFKHKILGLLSNKGQKSLSKENDRPKDDRYQVNSKNDFTHFKEDISENSKTLNPFLRQPEKKYIWSKRRWTSDFIDNIIRKMKKGMYYTHNSEDAKLMQTNVSESLIEAVTECESKEETNLENVDDISIPGFENTLNVAPLIVEVKMSTRSKISIHHCLTNVMLQFDIIIPSGVATTSSLSLSSFTPIAREGKTMLYKCKSSLPNAILPAQLCSVLPKLIAQINKAHKSVYEISKDAKVTPSFIPNTALTLPNTKARLTEGSFLEISPVDVVPKYKKDRNFFISDYDSHKKYMKLLPTIQMGPPFVPMNKCINLVISKYHIKDCADHLISYKPVINDCKALVPYVPCTTNSLPSSNLKLLLHNNYTRKYLLDVINFMISTRNSNVISNSESYHYLNELNGLGPNTMKKITINISIINQPLELFCGSNKSNYGCFEYNQKNLINRSIVGFTKTTNQKTLKNDKNCYQHLRKHPKKTFKTHKKCKSMTSMVKDSDRTLLNRIVTLEDFFQALGCCKQLTTVLRGYSEKKILTSISEMKCWIKEISQIQALLVLLLANKKETKNLKRFRPMLLQGIAVNRITTATELDMEIEVIEKENICISQNEGLSFLSTSHGYNLLDELYWIAKTTASDYQKPFDDSSKKLLKSLLEKRKKLNPSYLRVMARYVGLGLLKPSRKCL